MKKIKEGLRNEFIESIRAISVGCLQRSYLEGGSLCVETDVEADREDVERYAKIRTRLAGAAQKMADIEKQSDGQLGLAALDIPNEPEYRTAVALLLASGASDEVRRRADTVGELAALAVPQNVDAPAFLRVREAFAEDGVLRPLVTADTRRAENLSETRIVITERAWRTGMGLGDEETEFDRIKRLLG
jgi:hypothetical protein